MLKQLVLYGVNPIHCDFSEGAGYSRVKCFESNHSRMSAEWDSLSIVAACFDELIVSLPRTNSWREA
jgi:hypothetical protein